MKTKTIKLAIYKDVEFNFELAAEPNDSDRHIMLSEIKIVEFNLLPNSTILNSEIGAIDAEIEKTKTETLAKIEQLQTKKQELLALGSDNE